MSQDERCGIANGIWLCANHADEIDRDVGKYHVELLQRWKREAEAAAQAERGLTRPSTRELAIFKNLTIGENVTGESAVGLISGSIQIARQELERLDPRMHVDVKARNDAVTLEIHPLETIPIALHVSPTYATEFAAQFDALQRHGKTLKVDAKYISLTGSPIFDRLLSNHTGSLTIGVRDGRKAVVYVTYKKLGQSDLQNVAIVGETTGGADTFTFRGEAFDGLHEFTFSAPTSAKGKVDVAVTHQFDLRLWRDKPLGRLPYFEKFADFIRAGASGEIVEMSLEIEGNRILTGGSLELIGRSDIDSIAWLVEYLRMARDLTKLLKINAPFKLDQFSMDDAKWLQSVWELLVKCASLRGSAIPPLEVTLVANNESAANSILSSPLTGVKVIETLAKPLNIFGALIPVTISLDYSHAKVIPVIPGERAQPGKAYRVRISPEDDCTLHTTAEIAETP